MKIRDLERLISIYGKEARLIDVVNAIKKNRGISPCSRCIHKSSKPKGFRAETVCGGKRW